MNKWRDRQHATRDKLTDAHGVLVFPVTCHLSRVTQGFFSSLLGTTALWMALLSGCATTAPVDSLSSPPQAVPRLEGSYHQVRRGETLWRIAGSYGVGVQTLASANRLASAARLAVGQRLFIPLPAESARFVWPLRGTRVSAGASRGLEIAAPVGSFVRASRSGRVAVATSQLAGWGKTVILDHLDGYFTIYAGLDQIVVVPGASLRQGTPIGSLAHRPLHFEIRYGTRPHHAVALLPAY